jgi:hypothetical protein
VKEEKTARNKMKATVSATLQEMNPGEKRDGFARRGGGLLESKEPTSMASMESEHQELTK